MLNEKSDGIESIVDAFVEVLGSNLVGVYLHGSLAMDCFNPKSSDIDIIVVVKGDIEPRLKKKLMQHLVVLEEGSPKNEIEMSIVLEKDLDRGQHPLFFLLHYSEDIKSNFIETGLLCENGYDPDLVTHLIMIKARGKTLYGKPIETLPIHVKRDDFLDSVMNDIVYEEEDLKSKPEYVILNLCRTLQYLFEGTHNSKREGGQWAIGRFGPKCDGVISVLLERYVGKAVDWTLHDDDIETVAEHLLKEVDLKKSQSRN